MNPESVNPDDPEMTAYALGELSAAEAAEFEARLLASPKARREMASMRAVMSLLKEGLADEWHAECERPGQSGLRLLEPVAPPVAVPERLRPARRLYAAAAAVAATLVVGSLVLSPSNRTDRETVGSEASVASLGVSAVSSSSALPTVVAAAHVPQLFLAEEVEDLSALDLVGGEAGPVDASYLESDSVIPAGFQPTSAAGRGISERVDSYLPPLHGVVVRHPSTGMIESRLGRERKEGSRSPSVLVSGYMTLGGEDAAHLLGTFQPVSISGNPVVNEESDLRLLADLNGLKRDLSDVIREMPRDARERADLERILERSERVVAQLKSEISR